MRALIISLNFNPGHVSHMVASYKQCEELGYKSVYYVDSAFCPFLPKGSCVNIASGGIAFKVDLAVFLFPSQKNLPQTQQNEPMCVVAHEMGEVNT